MTTLVTEHAPTKSPAITPQPADTPARVEHVSFAEAARTWTRVALLSFGGPAGQIAVMHRILVEEKRWVSEERFLHALNYCMLLPGPEAQQLATYIGWLLHKAIGGLVAGILFVLPGAICILGLSILYAGYHDLSFVQAVFFGLKPAVVAIVVEAVVRIGKRALKNGLMVALAAAAFVAIFFFQIPFPWIILAAGLVGFIGGKLRPATFVVIKGHGKKDGKELPPPVVPEESLFQVRPTWTRAVVVSAICLTLWFGPIALLWLLTGRDSLFTQQALFFSKAAVVTFGGAYAVLAYIGQQAVDVYGWLKPGQMLDGLGMAETTPGPLIMVLQFVGFMGAYQNPGNLDPMLAGVIGSAITTWVTFVPCFFWIFLGAPYIEALRGNKSLSAALSCITAAVVGVVLNLSVWFTIHTLFAVVDERHFYVVRLLVPDWATLDVASALLALGAFVAIFWLKLGMIKTLAASVLLGAGYYLLT